MHSPRAWEILLTLLGGSMTWQNIQLHKGSLVGVFFLASVITRGYQIWANHCDTGMQYLTANESLATQDFNCQLVTSREPYSEHKACTKVMQRKDASSTKEAVCGGLHPNLWSLVIYIRLLILGGNNDRCVHCNLYSSIHKAYIYYNLGQGGHGYKYIHGNSTTGNFTEVVPQPEIVASLFMYWVASTRIIYSIPPLSSPVFSGGSRRPLLVYSHVWGHFMQLVLSPLCFCWCLVGMLAKITRTWMTAGSSTWL